MIQADLGYLGIEGLHANSQIPKKGANIINLPNGNWRTTNGLLKKGWLLNTSMPK
jgi:hypothetical protein